MVSLALAIANQLQTNEAITNLVGNRSYPEYDKQADHVFPLIVYKLENVTTSMASDGPIGLNSADLVLAAISPLYSDCDAIASAMVSQFDGASGNWNGLGVQGCFLKEDGIHDDSVTEPETESILYFVKTASFQIWYAGS